MENKDFGTATRPGVALHAGYRPARRWNSSCRGIPDFTCFSGSGRTTLPQLPGERIPRQISKTGLLQSAHSNLLTQMKLPHLVAHLAGTLPVLVKQIRDALPAVRHGFRGRGPEHNSLFCATVSLHVRADAVAPRPT